MPTDDYTTTARGALKIKGVSGSKIEKSHKKKKKKHPKPAQDEGAPTGSSSLGVDDGGEGEVKSIAKGRDVEGKDAGDEVVGSRRGEEGEGDEGESERGGRKTEAEKAFEERRRRMVSFAFFFYSVSFFWSWTTQVSICLRSQIMS